MGWWVDVGEGPPERATDGGDSQWGVARFCVCLLLTVSDVVTLPPLGGRSSPTEIVFAAVLLFCSACGTPRGTDAGVRDSGALDAAVPAGPLRVATWNLEFFPRDPNTVDAVARLIESERLDVIAVQEITDADSFFALAGQLGSHDAMIASGDDSFLMVGLLVRRDRVEVSDVQTLFRSDGYSFPRPVLSAVIRTRPGPGLPLFDLRLLVLHLKANLDEVSQDRRASAVLELEQWTTRQLADPEAEHDIVILGDYNDSLIDAAPDNVFAPFLERPSDYAALTLPLEQAGGRTFLPFDAFLDHVVVTSDALDEYGAGTTEVRHLEEELAEYPDFVSDHLPVVLTFVPE